MLSLVYNYLSLSSGHMTLKGGTRGTAKKKKGRSKKRNQGLLSKF